MIYWYKRLHNPGSSQMYLYAQKDGEVIDKIHVIVEGKIGEWDHVEDNEVFAIYKHKEKSFKLQEFGVERKYDFLYMNPVKIAKIIAENYEDWQVGEFFVEEWGTWKFKLGLVKIANCQVPSETQDEQEPEQKISYPTFNLIGNFDIVPNPKLSLGQFTYANWLPDAMGLIVKRDSVISYFDIAVGVPVGVYLMYYTRY